MTSRALDLRGMFDAEFTAAPRPVEAGKRDVLCVRVGGEPYAFVLDDIASLHAELKIIALPSRARELLGVAAIRAAVLPIYDLAVALGMSSLGTHHWAVVHRGGRLGFAFDGFDGHVRVADSAISAASRRGHITGQLAVGGSPRLVVDLGSVVAGIETRWNQGGTAKDQ